MPKLGVQVALKKKRPNTYLITLIVKFHFCKIPFQQTMMIGLFFWHEQHCKTLPPLQQFSTVQVVDDIHSLYASYRPLTTRTHIICSLTFRFPEELHRTLH